MSPREANETTASERKMKRDLKSIGKIFEIFI